MTDTSFSRIYINGINQHDCGYCKGLNSSHSYGIISDAMNVSDYESLMLIGWRRSGKYFYKPIMYETCCPQYTIRLSVQSFRPSKSQNKVIKKMNSYVNSCVNEKKDLADFNSTTTTERFDLSENAINSNCSLQIGIESSSFSEEKFLLYRKYQMSVHQDEFEELTQESFTRFLVTSPLIDSNPNYGTFHQTYRLQGQLIAVAVLDFLPSGISSVYFFYDVDFKQLSLGKFSALTEIDLCRSRCLSFYYLGFYIHDCDKMSYKGDYQPSELLCPTSLDWLPMSQAIPLLDKHRFCPLLDPHRSIRLSLDDQQSNSSETLRTLFFPRHKSDEVVEIQDILLVICDNNNNNNNNDNNNKYNNNNNVVSINHLTKRGQQIVKPLLEELCFFVGPEIVRRLHYNNNKTAKIGECQIKTRREKKGFDKEDSIHHHYETREGPAAATSSLLLRWRSF